MTTTQKQMKLGRETNSFMNWMMSSNSSKPEVGKGATILRWTDRDVAQVVEVSEDGKTVKLENMEAYTDHPSPMGHQDWLFRSTGQFTTLVFYRGAWRIKTRAIHFDPKFIADYEKRTGQTFYGFRKDAITEELREAIYEGGVFPKNVIEGVTKESFKYKKINILFGKMDYYYDWSF